MSPTIDGLHASYKQRVNMAQRLLKNSTVKVAEALQRTLMEHANMRKAVVCVEGLLMALLEQKDSVVLRLLEDMNLRVQDIRAKMIDHILSVMNQLPDFEEGRVAHLQMSKDLLNAFEAADRERQRLGDAYISTGTLFLGMFSDEVPSTRRLLRDLGLSYETTIKALERLRGNNKITERDAESRQSLMEEYTTDITALARRGELDPVILRDAEIERVIEILSRRKKNNPLLIGEPGVGKTVIVEGLANRIANGEVPEFLLNKRILSLEMANLLAGAKMQGEFEERLKTIVQEVQAAAGDVILFIDEIHTVVGAGRTGGALDASNMLKPALARGDLQCIGATTQREFKQYIESDKALARRFEPIQVDEPSVIQTVDILLGIKSKYEKHHGIVYTDDALKAAAELADRYVTDRCLPDKAIDLMDEAGAVKRLKAVYTPPRIRELDQQKHELNNKKSQAFNEQNFEAMAQFQMDLARLEVELEKERQKLNADQAHADRTVDREDIAQVLSKKTGIPVTKVAADEAARLNNLEQRLQSRVIGQAHAVKSVSDAIRRNRSGLRKPGAPIATFLFVGPTGVGKTELAKAIAAEMMDDESRIIRVDMSEFMERHTVSKLIGSPPGYVGYGEGGQLTEQVKRQPYSVVLFDEFEKAHPDVFNVLLQVFDEGWLTDGEGHKVSFRNCVIIGTSNIGSDILTSRKSAIGIGAQVAEWSKDEQTKTLFQEIRKHFRPEFINRLDEIIVFNKLGEKELQEILNLSVTDLNKRLTQLGLTLKVEDAAKKYILAQIDTFNYGARPLRRKIEQLVENRVAELLLMDPDRQKKQVTVGLINNQLDIKLE